MRLRIIQQEIYYNIWWVGFLIAMMNGLYIAMNKSMYICKQNEILYLDSRRYPVKKFQLSECVAC